MNKYRGPWDVVKFPMVGTTAVVDIDDNTVCEPSCCAHLIAAAPDMLKALEESKMILDNFGGGSDNVFMTIMSIEHTIAKAKGE